MKHNKNSENSNKDLNALDEFGYTKLHLGIFNGTLKDIESLIKQGADVNQKTSYGDTALHLAAIMGYVEVVELLLQNRAEIDIKDREGKTAFDLAIEKNNEVAEVLQEWKEKGDILNDEDYYYNTIWTMDLDEPGHRRNRWAITNIKRLLKSPLSNAKDFLTGC